MYRQCSSITLMKSDYTYKERMRHAYIKKKKLLFNCTIKPSLTDIDKNVLFIIRRTYFHACCYEFIVNYIVTHRTS